MSGRVALVASTSVALNGGRSRQFKGDEREEAAFVLAAQRRQHVAGVRKPPDYDRQRGFKPRSGGTPRLVSPLRG